MSKKQTRRSISVRGSTYFHLRDYCLGRSISMSDFLEQRIAEFFAGKPVEVVAASPPPPAAEPVRPLPPTSTLSVKRPPATVASRVATTPPKPNPHANVGRPKPTPAGDVLKARTSPGSRNDYRGIRF